ncbi:MAG TPA: glycosyltransferase, partial [Myxococcales bacterium]|nr:glycosyltransferase [Myxococcales bacterium]
GPPRGAPLDLPPGVPVVSFVSRGLEAYRGFDHFMEIARRVSRRHPDVHFAVCGAEQTYYGNELSHLRAPSFKAHVLERVPVDPSRVHFLGHVPEESVADLFRITTAHFHWTVVHAMSWSPLQALAAGALVIAPDCEPVRDVIQDGANGQLFPPEDVDAAAERILHALADPGAAAAMRARARESILARHAPAVACPKIADFILEGTGAD